MTELQPVYSLSISGRLTLEMHSLNNEGGEGNQTMTRMVTLVDSEGSVHKVNAISGDMFKHIQAEHFYRLAREAGLPLCEGCSVFHAERITHDSAFRRKVGERRVSRGKGESEKRTWAYSDDQLADELIRVCSLDDAEGVLVAPKRGSGAEDSPGSEGPAAGGSAGGRSLPRKSVAEFAWVVGLPDRVRTDTYFHVRYAAERGGPEQVEQPIFHRPASSGVYAAVANFEMARIGFNDISQQYPLDEQARLERYRTLMQSIAFTYVEPNGAMRGTQNPHILGFEGVITASHAVVPAPTISPLGDGYRAQVEDVAHALDSAGRLEVLPFDTMASFAEHMTRLTRTTRPYRLFSSQGG